MERIAQIYFLIFFAQLFIGSLQTLLVSENVGWRHVYVEMIVMLTSERRQSVLVGFCLPRQPTSCWTVNRRQKNYFLIFWTKSSCAVSSPFCCVFNIQGRRGRGCSQKHYFLKFWETFFYHYGQMSIFALRGNKNPGDNCRFTHLRG